MFALAIGLSTWLARTRPEAIDATLPLWPLATILFIPLAAYGVLSAHLFDIDLRIKWTIRRGTAGTIAVAAVLAVAKVAEAFLQRELGLVAGSLMAGPLLFAAPRLNRLGDRVANAALPSVQPTSAYFAFKKMEVYRAALEAALETGGIGERERASLDRLRRKLGIDSSDALATEAELDALPAR